MKPLILLFVLSALSVKGAILTISNSAPQPADSLAPLRAVRIPFTKVTFTASNGNVTNTACIVQRTGSSVDAVLESIVALDESGVEMGDAVPLNARHQAVLPAHFIVKDGTSRTITFAGNRPQWNSAAHHGMVVGLSLVGLQSSALVQGELPIVGARHTINEGLRIGSATVIQSPFDPGQDSLQYVDTRYTFSGIRITADPAERLIVKGIRWRQNGSAVANDLAEVKVHADWHVFPVVADANGYYVSWFEGGVVLEPTGSVDIYIRGDIQGGPERTVDFDIEQPSDIYVTGEEYGFDIFPTHLGSATTHYPFYDARQVTISAGALRVSNSDLAISQNLYINRPNQMAGGFKTFVSGTPIFVRRLGFNVALDNEDVRADVDALAFTLTDETGKIIAGPVNGWGVDSQYTVGSSDGSVFFTNVTFPVGSHHWFIKVMANTDININTTIQLSTTPCSDFYWASSATNGRNLTPTPCSEVTLNRMTFKEIAGPSVFLQMASLTDFGGGTWPLLKASRPLTPADSVQVSIDLRTWFPIPMDDQSFIWNNTRDEFIFNGGSLSTVFFRVQSP